MKGKAQSEEFRWGLAGHLMLAVIAVAILSLAMQSDGDSVPGGVIATPVVTSSPAATELVHGKSLFTSETIIPYVFFDARTPSAGPPTVVSTQFTDLTTLTQIRTDTTTEVLYRVPCHERVEVWNRTTWTVYLQPNVGLQGNQWNETTPTMTKALALTKLGPLGGTDLPNSVEWLRAEHPEIFGQGGIWNVGVIIEDDGTYESAATLRSEFTSGTGNFIILGR